MVEMIIGTFALSLALTYAWWCKVRVVRLRQDIFDLRDDLFDVALKEQAFAEPAYRFARKHLNAVAKIADSITIPAMVFVLHRGVGQYDRPQCRNARLNAAIDESLCKCSLRIAKFLMNETFTGCVLLPFVHLVNIGSVIEHQTTRWIDRWVKSTIAEELSQPSISKVTARSYEGTNPGR